MSTTVEFGFDARKVEAGLNSLETRLKTFGSSIQKSVPNLSSIMGIGGNAAAAFAGLAGAVTAIKGTTSAYGDLMDAADKLGETPEVLQRVQFAAELSGNSLDGVASSMIRLEKALGDADNEAAAKAFENMGLSAQKLAAMPLDEKMIALAEAFQQSRASGTSFNDIMTLMGKSAADLIPMLSTNTQELRKLMDEASVLPASAVQSLATLDDAIDTSVTHVKTGFGSILAMGKGLVDMLAGASFGDALGTSDETVKKQLEQEQEKKKKADEQEARRQDALAKQQQESLDRAAEKYGIIREREIELLEPAQRLIALQDLLAAKIDQMRAGAGGSIFAASVQGMKDYAQTGIEQRSPDAEARIQSLQKILDIQAKIQTTEQGLAKTETDSAAVTEAAEKQKQEAIAKTAELAAQENARRMDATSALAMEIALMQAKAQGQTALVAALEREQEIRRRTAEIMSQTGMGEDEAKRVATSMVDAQARIDQRQNAANTAAGAAPSDDREGRIKGYSFKTQGGAYERQDHLYGAGSRFRDNQANLLKDQAAKNGQERSTPGQDTSTAQTALQTIQQILTTLQGGA
jgi:hypothetical protein